MRKARIARVAAVRCRVCRATSPRTARVGTEALAAGSTGTVLRDCLLAGLGLRLGCTVEHLTGSDCLLYKPEPMASAIGGNGANLGSLRPKRKRAMTNPSGEFSRLAA